MHLFSCLMLFIYISLFFPMLFPSHVLFDAVFILFYNFSYEMLSITLSDSVWFCFNLKYVKCVCLEREVSVSRERWLGHFNTFQSGALHCCIPSNPHGNNPGLSRCIAYPPHISEMDFPKTSTSTWPQTAQTAAPVICDAILVHM